MAGFEGGMSWVIMIAIVMVGVLIASFILPWLQGLFAKKA